MNIIWADTLEKTFQTTCTDEEMMGSAISIMFSDNSIWSSAHGYHGSSTPLTTDMLYDMGSSSKTMIASLIFMLEDEDLLSIEDTIYSYITPIQNIPFGIRIKHLMGHTSGVFSYTNHPNFGPTINNDKSKFWHPDSILATFLNPPNFAIGTHYSYSNTGYILLGKVIESIEKKPLNQVLAERIFNPLRLKHMYLDQYDTYSEVKTGAWLSESNYYDGNYVSFMSSAWAAGGIVTKPEDCARYAHALGSGQLFEGNVTNRVFSNCNELSSSEWYGYGLIKTIYNNHVYLGHDGRTIQNAEMEYSVDSEFSLVVLNLDYDYYYEVRRLKFEMLDLVEYIEATNNSLLDTINAR
jgi:CubicO group peptidase (beta-lactamase class C family)